MRFEQVMSLGEACATQYQIAREFRPRGIGVLNGPFDWQATPPKTVVEYFRTGFTGMFEREDLVLVDPGPEHHPFSIVRNMRHATDHIHEFDRGGDIDACYARVRARHDHLCTKVRTGLASERPTLFVISADLDRGVLVELLAEIEKLGHGRHQLLWLDPRPLRPSKRVPYQWRGNFPFWSHAFAQTLARPDETVHICRPTLKQLATFYGVRLARHIQRGRF